MILTIQTQGYGGIATREYLNLLHRTLDASVPFLYFSDHDVHGMHIFSIFKYGARSTAYATDWMACPRLEWAGPTVEEMFQFHKSGHDNDKTWANRERSLAAKLNNRLTRTDWSL